ncbi:MAG TPA: FtsX-like permease family protein [Anaeromyxobacteraceae bacterium]|nr:FtsX-like permease family protein [Anaeromyxobacteraceae bacterium]
MSEGGRSRARQGRILVQIAMRNLVASRVRTLVVGGIVALGVVVVVLGSSLLDSIDAGMTRSIQDSLGGHVQLYNAASRDALALYGGTMGESVLEPIEDFARLKAAALSVPGVKQVIPMGIDQAMVSMGNVFDVALERLRADVRRRLEQGPPAEDPQYEAHKAHLRRMATLLQTELRQAREIADETSGVYKDRRADFEALERAVQAGFWERFDDDPLASLEFLENRVAPLSLDGGFTFIRYVGTDPEAFQKAFPGSRVVEGTPIPPGQRGVLLGKLYAEEWLKLRAARRLDKIKEARDVQGRTIAKDEELQRWVKENTAQTRDILLQLDPTRTREAVRRLQAALGTREEDPAKLVSALLDTDDARFDERYRIFYAELAPLLQLYTVKVGDFITIKAPGRSGYVNAVNVPVYGFVEFRGLERSALAGMMSVLDVHSWRDLYGYLTPERAAEIRRLRERSGARAIAREDAEAALFGGGDEPGGGNPGAGAAPGAGPSAAAARPAAIEVDEARLLAGANGKAQREDLFKRRYTQAETDAGVALNAAVILDDPRRIQETMPRLVEAAARAGLKVKAVTWLEASGIVGQSMGLLRMVLYLAVLIIFAVALVIINNAMVMATLQRVKEIGTMRAIGAQRRFVLVLVVLEVVTTGLLFGGAGAALGILLVHAIGWAGGIAATNDTMYFLFSGPALIPRLGTASLVTSVAIVVLVSVLSALYPALLAMRVTPLEAMQSDD